MNKSNSNKVKLGIFVTAGLILFAMAVYYVGNKQSMFGNTFSVSAIFRNVNGLQTGNNVRYSGINIGTVNRIYIISDTAVQVDMVIDESIRSFIRKDAVATITSDGLVGNMIVSIIPGDHQGDLLEPNDFIRSYSRIGASDMLNTLNVTNENAAILTADLLKITEGIIQRKGTVGTLLYDSALARDIKLTLANLRISSQNINMATDKLNTSLDVMDNKTGLLQLLTEDTVISGRLSETIANLHRSSSELDSATRKLDVLLDDIKNENGPVNALIYDSIMINNFRDAINNVKEGTHKFNENMEAMKHNFLFRKYFKKQEKLNNGKKVGE